jgi:hypothetical protein
VIARPVRSFGWVVFCVARPPKVGGREPARNRLPRKDVIAMPCGKKRKKKKIATHKRKKRMRKDRHKKKKR